MKQRWKRRLSFVVVLAMMIGLLSVGAPVVAQTVDDGTLPVSALPSSLQLALDDTDPTARVVERESLFEVETRTADGHGKIEQFAVPIKYIDEDGKQQYIDTAMEPLGLLQRSFGKYDYKNAANSFTVRYSEDAATGLDFDGDFTTAVANPYQAAGDAYIAADAEAGNKLVYPDAFGEYTAVEYINGSRGIKENIILERYTGQNTFSFVLKSDTLTPSLLNGGEAVQLTSAGSRDAAYIISPLYVYDSYVPGAVTDTFRHHTTDCHYELQTLGDGEYLLTYVVDAEWLASPNVVWPVTVDPSINTTDQSLIGDIADSHVVQGNPNAYYYGYNSLRFGYSENTNTQRIYSFIDFNVLPTIPANACVNDAQLWLRFRSGQTTFADGECFLVSSDRNFNAVNWNNQPSFNESVRAKSLVLSQYNDEGAVQYRYYQFAVTPMVSGWYDGTYPNYGLRFGYEDETVVDSNTVHSSEATYATSAPKLTVSYFIPITSPVSLRMYYIRNVDTGKYLTTDSSANVMQKSFTALPGQIWQLSLTSDGYYELIPQLLTYKRLDLENAATGDGTNVQIYQSNSTDAQKFSFLPQGDGTYSIRPKSAPTRALEITNSSTAEEANVQIWTYYDELFQKWKLEDASPGAAPEFRDVTGNGENCYGFAFHILESPAFIRNAELGTDSTSSLDEVVEKTIDYFQSRFPNRRIRRIPGVNISPTFPISDNEYRVALRIRPQEGTIPFDYHYMRQLPNGYWAHKQGRAASAILGPLNPSTYNWNYMYNSDVIYFAVTI